MTPPAPPAVSPWWSALVPIASFVGGYVAKAISDWMQDARAAKREREARREARRDVVLERRADFQRENLIALQDACSTLARATGQASHSDEMTYKQTGVWGRGQMPDGVSEGFRVAQVNSMTRMVRVRDEGVRNATFKFRSTCVKVVNATSKEDHTSALKKLGPQYEDLMTKIGSVLRTLDDETLTETNNTP